jgi:hypothetical protein
MRRNPVPGSPVTDPQFPQIATANVPVPVGSAVGSALQRV